MAPGDANRRIEGLEEEINTVRSTIRATVAEEVAAALKAAVAAMEQTLANRFLSGVEETLKRQESKWEETTNRLEGRISRSREFQESMIKNMREEQVKFQKEIRSVLTIPKTVERSINLEGGHGIGKFGGLTVGESSHTGASQLDSAGIGGAGSGNGPGGGYDISGGIGSGSSWRYKRLDLPLFDGSNPDGWILRAERYFNFYRLNEEEKIEATVVALEGQALTWFEWEHKRRPVESWGQVKALLRRQFRSLATGTLQEQWLSNTQTGTVSEY